jgi:hypothetical protein
MNGPSKCKYVLNQVNYGCLHDTNGGSVSYLVFAVMLDVSGEQKRKGVGNTSYCMLLL